MHPFSFIDSKYYFRIVFITLLLTFLVMAGMQWTEYNLQNEISPSGIVTLELAGNLELVQSIIAQWRADHVMGYAGFNVGLDYLFLILYSTLIGMVCVLISNGFDEQNFFRKFGYTAAWVIIFSALLDAVENVALINLLTDSTDPLWVRLSYYCALTKFIGVGIGIAFILIGGIASGIQRAMRGA